MSSSELTAGLLTIYQTAAVLKVSVSTVYTWTERGFMPPPVLFGGRQRWRLEDLKQWAAAGFPHRDPELKGAKS